MNLRLLTAAAVLALSTGAVAHADPLLFTLTGPNDTASFVLDSTPTGSVITNSDGTMDFNIDNVSGAFAGDGSGPAGNNVGPQTVGTVQFYDALSGGGIEVNEVGGPNPGFGIFSLEGSQVFSGDISSPTFAPGSFTFTNDFFYGPVSETLTITDDAVSAAPEPSTWALMLGGIGILGGMMRIARARRREDEATGMTAA